MNMKEMIMEENYFGHKTEMAYVSTSQAKKKRKGTAIKDDELLIMFNDIKETFGDDKFGSKNLKEMCVRWGLTSGQIPSRLNKLAKQGLLTRFETTPLSFQVV